jgi:ABC-2 type transport system permease protein
MWSVPQIYSWEFVVDAIGGTWLEQVYLANPVAVAVLLNQRAFWVPSIDGDTSGLMPDYLLLRGGLTLVACLVLLAAAQAIFTRLESGFAEKL